MLAFDINVLGQACVLHVVVSEVVPLHALPPYWGAGLVQLLVLVDDPVPQVKLHEPQLPHADRPPSTKTKVALIHDL